MVDTNTIQVAFLAVWSTSIATPILLRSVETDINIWDDVSTHSLAVFKCCIVDMNRNCIKAGHTDAKMNIKLMRNLLPETMFFYLKIKQPIPLQCSQGVQRNRHQVRISEDFRI